MAQRNRLGKILVKKEVIDQHQLEEAMRLQEREDKFLGQILVEKGWGTEEEITETISDSLHLSIVHVKDVLLSQKIVELIPRSLAVNHHVLPLFIQNKKIYLAMENPLDIEVIREVESRTRMRVIPMVAFPSQLQRAIRRHYNMNEYVGSMLGNVKEQEADQILELDQILGEDDTTQSPGKGEHGKNIQKSKATDQIVNLAKMIFSKGIKTQASHIYIEPSARDVKVRYKLDGVFTQGIKLPKVMYTPLLSRIKMLSGMNIADHKTPQKGQIRMKYAQRKIDLQISTMLTDAGEKVIVRILDQKRSLDDISLLGLSPEHLSLCHTFIKKPQGLILLTGPAGSGKTTTAYALIRALKNSGRRIITLEDPIAHKLDGISQVQVDRRSGRPFTEGWQAVLQQNPEIILLGEIRDAETASAAIQAAATGRLVISTLHEMDVFSTLDRLFTLGFAPDLVASNLIAVVTQRLVRRICPQCREEFTPDLQELQSIGIPELQAELAFFRGDGCDACKEIGYQGQIGIYEFFVPNERLRHEVAKPATKRELKRLAIEVGMKTLLEDGIDKMHQGITTIEEITRVCPPEQGVMEAISQPSDTTEAPIQSEVTETCEQCGASLQEDWLMCPVCGTRKSSKMATASMSMGEARIVVAEDNKETRKFVQLLLKRNGYQVIPAVDGEEALEKIRIERPDLVILDIDMPRQSGFSVCKAMRSSIETMFIPIIMLTARGTIEAKLHGLSLGADDYITKPFHADELLLRINVILRRAYQNEVVKK